MKKESLYKASIVCAISSIVLFIAWVFLISPHILKLPADFSYEADIESFDDFYDKTTGQFEGEKPSKTKFWYAGDGYENNALKIWYYFDVRKLNGESIFKVQQQYSFDPFSGQVILPQDTKRIAGYLFAPRHLKRQDFYFLHPNYSIPILMKFRDIEYLSGLKVYRYDSSYLADLGNLPDVSADQTVKANSYLTLWIEPTSGRMVKYLDIATSYIFDVKTGAQLNPRNKFRNSFSDLSVTYQIEMAKYEKYKILLIEKIVPLVLFFVMLVWVLLARKVRKKIEKKSFDVLDEQASIKVGLKAVYFPLIVFILTLLISLGVWRILNNNLRLQVNSEFEVETARLQAEVLSRLEIYMNVLRSGRGLFLASDNVSREEWKSFVEELKLNVNYPGVQGLGYAKYISQNEKDKLTVEIQQQGLSDFHITPQGVREFYVPIVYLEPFFGSNIFAFGFDMYSEKIRQEALEKARDKGEIQLSSKVTLIQDIKGGSNQPGMLMYMPIYLKGSARDSIEQRRQAIYGFVFGAFRMNDLLAGIRGNKLTNFDFMIFDGPQSQMSEATQLFKSSQNQNENTDKLKKNKGILTKVSTIEIAGHPWTFYFYNRPGFGLGPFESSFPFFVLLMGVSFGILLAGSFYFLSYTRFRAVDIAKEMTSDLRKRTEENEGMRKQLELTLADVQNEQAISRVLGERLRLATQSAKIGIWDWDIVNDTLIWDEQMYRLYGIKEENFSGAYEAWQKAVHPKDIVRQNQEIIMALKGEKDFDTEFRVIWPDGIVHYIKARALVQRDDVTGKAVRMIGVNWDTTQRRQVEQLLEDQKYALDKSAIVAMTDVAGNIIYANDNFCKISQYSREELMGQNHRMVKSGEHSTEFFREMWRTIAQGKIWQGEVKNKAKDGSFYWVDATIIPFLNDEQKPYQYMAIRFDITARKLAEAQLKESQRKLLDAVEVKSKFVSIVSHELRTPLAAIQEGINLVVDGSLGELNAKQRQFLDLSHRNVERLTRLINDVLDFQKMQNNALEMDFTRQDINEIVREVCRSMESFIVKKSLAFHLDLQPDLPAVILDRDKIIQVLTNLINNALRNTDQGAITIVSSLKDDQAHIEIRDTGIGIKEENISRLFLSFQQFGDESRRTGGTGLGLVICKEIITRHKGRIWAESQWGKGSNFQFTLPLS